MSAIPITRPPFVEFDPAQIAPRSIVEALDRVQPVVLHERPNSGTPFTPAVIRLSRVPSDGRPDAGLIARLATPLLLVQRADGSDEAVRVHVDWQRTFANRAVAYTLQIPQVEGLANLDEALQIVTDIARFDPVLIPRVVASLTRWGSVSVLRGAA